MAALNLIVRIAITIGAVGLSRKGFGTPLIAGYHTYWTQLVREFADPSELLDLDVPSHDPIYKAASAIMSQKPKPEKFKVGKISTFFQGYVFTPVVVNNAVYTIVFEYLSVDYTGTFTADGTATAKEIVEGLLASFGAVDNVDITEDDTKITIAPTEGTCAYVKFFDRALFTLSQNQGESDGDIAADLAAIKTADDDWYGLTLAVNIPNVIEDGAAWIETQDKIFSAQYCASDAWDPEEGGDLGSTLGALSYRNTFLIPHLNTNEFIAAGALGMLLPYDPGSYTAAFKNIKGSSADAWTPGELSALRAKHYLPYVEISGASCTLDGKMIGGEFIDIPIFEDWLVVRMQERIFALQLNNKKIPYTDTGMTMLQGQIEAQLQEGVEVGGLSPNPAPTVTVPKVANVPTADKTERIARKIKFSGILAGAVHETEIEGTISI